MAVSSLIQLDWNIENIVMIITRRLQMNQIQASDDS